MSWTKVLPPHFLAARETALMRAQDYEEEHGLVPSRHTNPDYQTSHLEDGRFYPEDQAYQQYDQQTPTSHYDQQTHPNQHLRMQHQPIYSQSQQQQPLYSYGVRPPFETSPIQHPMQGSVASTAASPYVGHERYESLFHHQQNATSRTPSSYLRHIQGDRDAMAAMDDTSLPIDEAIASHAARAGPPVPLASSMGGGGIDPPEDEPPSLRKRGGVAYRSNSITSADPSHRSAHNMEASAFQGSAYHEGSAYNEGSAYQGSTYQEGSAYDESIEHHTSYYQEENDTYNDFHQRKIQYHPNDEYQHDEGYDQQQPTQSEDEYDGQGEFTDFERTEHYQQGDEFHQRADFLHHSDKHDNELRHESYDESSPKASESHFSAPYSPDDEIAENSPFNMKYNLSPTSETEVTEFTVPTVTEGPYGAESPNSSADYSNHVHENSRQHGNSPLPPMSPRSANGTEYSQSSAMRGAQELLRRNRQKRLELAQRMKSPDEKASCEGEAATPDDEGINPDVISPQSQDSNSTWQTGASEHTSSEVTGGSSMWDGDSHPDRSSRRALILQMARARMKSHGIKGVDAGGLEDEKKLDPARDSTNDIDITADLD